jgi:hypothetical protein
MSAGGQAFARSLPEAGRWTLVAVSRSLHALIVAPSLLFLATMTVMLFRPPDIQLYWLDRIALLLLVFVVLLRVLVLRQSLRVAGLVTWPMLGLLLLALFSLLAQPYEPQTWSVFAAKWAVPFILYYLSGFAFDDALSLRKLEIFAIIVLGYLSLIAILFLFDAKDLIFPRYILDESLGIHADRARGPFRRHPQSAGINRAGLFSTTAIAGIARATVCDRLTTGRLGDANPGSVVIFCRVRASVGLLLSQSASAPGLPLPDGGRRFRSPGGAQF